MVFVMFFIVMPVMGNLWVDLSALRTALQVELHKMQKMRRELQVQQIGDQ